MIEKINGSEYLELLSCGVENVDRHRRILNELNVFPVPDGDTGTNMAMTMKHGLAAAREASPELSEISSRFSKAAVFGARGNSGVISSQFFKGLAEGFCEVCEADATCLHRALECGVHRAYTSVAKPVEGTMLTVLRESTEALGRALPLSSVDEAVAVLLSAARASLKRTPELLPVLKKAGVVDSGASGIVYFFDGMARALSGEPLEDGERSETEAVNIDLSKFNKDTRFEYGYCVEGLLQLLVDPADFDYSAFKRRLSTLGESLVTTLEGDKVKLHIHTRRLAPIMDLCQSCGELLTVKIDNMTVQNTEREADSEEEERVLFDPEREIGQFATVAVATSRLMQRTLFELGADAVILSELAPSAKEFMDAFALLSAEDILVFPNSSNSILTSMQAGSLYKNASVRVLNSRTTQECYAALSVLDFDTDADSAVSQINSVVSALSSAYLYHAVKDADFGNKHIKKNEFFALSGGAISATGDSLESVALTALRRLVRKREASVVTLFYGKNIAEEYVAHLTSAIEELVPDAEIAVLPTDEAAYSLALTVE